MELSTPPPHHAGVPRAGGPRVARALPLLCALAGLAALGGCASDDGQGADGAATAEGWSTLGEDLPTGPVMALARAGDSLVTSGGQAVDGVLMTSADDGATFEVAALPRAVSMLNWVHGWPGGEAVAVGHAGDVLWRDPASGAWVADSLGADIELWGVWGASPGEVWAVGGEVRTPLIDYRPSVWRHGGAYGVDGSWEEVALPELSRGDNLRIFKLAGHAAADVMAVGSLGVSLRWDGAAWQEVSTGTGTRLSTVRATQGGGFVAVGGAGTGKVLRYTGGAWSVLAETNFGLSGVTELPDGRLVVAGEFGNAAIVDLEGGVQALDPVVADVLHFAEYDAQTGQLFAGGGNFERFPKEMHGSLLVVEAP